MLNLKKEDNEFITKICKSEKLESFCISENISKHSLKSQLKTLLKNMGIKNPEYELLYLISSQKNLFNTYKNKNQNSVLNEFTQYEYELLEKLTNKWSISDLCNDFGLSLESMKSEFKLMLEKLGIINVEYELLKNIEI